MNLAMSIDGFIADEDGAYDWITGQGDDRLDTVWEYPFSEFLSGIDVVVMGNRCYEQGFAEDYADKTVYVASNIKRENEENIRFISGNIVDTVIKERDAGKNIYLFGGGIVIDPFIKADAVDEYIIGIVPVLLGKGRPLFLGNNPTITLHLDHYSFRDGIAIVYYSKRP